MRTPLNSGWLLALAMATLLVGAGCSPEDETGSIQLKLLLSPPPEQIPGIRGKLSGIADQVLITVNNSGKKVDEKECAYETLSCSLDGIPAGSGYEVVAEVLDTGGVAFYRGSTTGVTIVKDHTTTVPVTVTAAYTTDIYPPAPVTDLQAEVPAGTKDVQLTWTASGNDGLLGRAASYLIWWSQDPQNIEQGNQVDGPIPSDAGVQEQLTLKGLPLAATYYFALKVQDKAGNTSELSNITSATLPGP